MLKKFLFIYTLAFSLLTYSQTEVDETDPMVKTNFYKDGIIARITWYGYDKKIDSLKTYYKSGNLKEDISFKNGKYDGNSYQYNEKGELLTIWIFENGKLIERKNIKMEFTSKTEERTRKQHLQLETINAKINKSNTTFSKTFTRASLRYRLGNYTLALNDFKKLERYIRKFPKEKLEKYHRQIAAVYDCLGSIYSHYEMENYATHYQYKALKASPEQSRLYHNLGSYLIQIKSYDLGINYLNQAVEMAPNHTFAHWVLAITYTELEDYKKAMYHVQISFKNEKSLYKYGVGTAERDLRTIRGLLFHKLGETEKGINDLEEALEINEDNSFAMRNLGVVLYETQQYEEACELLQKAKELFYESKHRKTDLQEYIDLACNKEIFPEQKEKRELPFIFPNPAADIIELRNYDLDNFVYEIVTHNNQTVKKGKASGKRIDLSGLEHGLYILRVVDTETPISLRIIKK